MKYLKTFENYKENNTVLDISGKGLLEFPEEFLPLKQSLKELYCSYNKLSVLPELPNSLTQLYCGVNKLSVLPELPNSLIELLCYSNKLSVLPELPKSLSILNCSDNNLSVLPELPKSLEILCCGNNNWIEPIPYKYYNLAIDNKDIYSNEQKKKFGSYKFQKEFLEEYPFRYMDLEPIGVDPKIRKEYEYLWNFGELID